MTVMHSAAASYVPSGAGKRNFPNDGSPFPQAGLIVPFTVDTRRDDVGGQVTMFKFS